MFLLSLLHVDVRICVTKNSIHCVCAALAIASLNYVAAFSTLNKTKQFIVDVNNVDVEEDTEYLSQENKLEMVSCQST